MTKTVVIDELHLTCRIPRDLPDNEADAVRRALGGKEFLNRLRRAVRDACRGFPALAGSRWMVTR